MNTVELDIRKASLARRILNEENPSVVFALDESLQKLQRKSSAERRKMRDDFWTFIDKVRQPTAGFKFNREECYDREILH
jgi:hypothetical protein